MSLDIKQVLPSNNNTTTISNVSNNKIDLCKGFSLPNLQMSKDLFPKDLTNPFSGLSDLTSAIGDKLAHGIGNLDMPDFTLGKIDALRLKGLSNPFECSMRDLSSGKGASLGFKSKLGNLAKINCDDVNGGLDDNSIRNKYLKNAMDLGNCSKEANKAVEDAAKDLEKLGIPVTDVEKSISKTVIASVVDNKFDIGTAKGLLSDPEVSKSVKEQMKLSSTPFDNLIKVSNNTKTSVDKEDTISYATSIVSSDKIASNPNSPIMQLTKQTALDSNRLHSSLPTGTALSSSQKILSISKAKSITSRTSFFKSLVA